MCATDKKNWALIGWDNYTENVSSLPRLNDESSEWYEQNWSGLVCRNEDKVDVGRGAGKKTNINDKRHKYVE